MRSEDWIQGPVLQVLSEGVFEMQVLWVGRGNDFPYDARERVRMEGRTLALATLNKKAAVQEFLPGKIVRCYVQARDAQGVLVGEVEICGDD